jgi:hypothetical protein
LGASVNVWGQGRDNKTYVPQTIARKANFLGASVSVQGQGLDKTYVLRTTK